MHGHFPIIPMRQCPSIALASLFFIFLVRYSLGGGYDSMSLFFAGFEKIRRPKWICTLLSYQHSNNHRDSRTFSSKCFPILAEDLTTLVNSSHEHMRKEHSIKLLTRLFLTPNPHINSFFKHKLTPALANNSKFLLPPHQATGASQPVNFTSNPLQQKSPHRTLSEDQHHQYSAPSPTPTPLFSRIPAKLSTLLQYGEATLPKDPITWKQELTYWTSNRNLWKASDLSPHWTLDDAH